MSLLASCSQTAVSTTSASAISSTQQSTQTVKSTTASPSGEVYTLSFGVSSDETQGHLNYNPVTNRFKDRVYEMSGGRIIIKSKVDLVPDTEIPMAVIDGRLDMGNFMTNWSSGTFPTWDFSLPFMFKNISQFEKLTQDPEFINIMRDSYAAKGLYYLGEDEIGGNNVIWSNKPLGTVDDLKNLKIRSGGLMPTVALKELGAAPVTMTFSEVAEAMNRGTIDAIVCDLVWAPQVGMMDVAKYVDNWGINIVGGSPQIMNLEKWNSLPPDLQTILSDAIWEQIRADNWARYLVELQMDKIISNVGKVQIITPDTAEIDKASQIAIPKVQEEWLKVAEPCGTDLLKLIQKYTE